MGLTATGLTVTYDGATATAKVYGIAKDQATKEKIILSAGNIHGIAAVDDNMTVDLSEPEAQFYTVVKGDTLSKIRSSFMVTPMQYQKIFEANKPMLTHPDKIYPGQNLRIPPQVTAPPPIGSWSDRRETSSIELRVCKHLQFGSPSTGHALSVRPLICRWPFRPIIRAHV